MTDHAGLLKDAREWAEIDASADRKVILRALADLVEKYHKSNAQLIAACNTILAGPGDDVDDATAWAQGIIRNAPVNHVEQQDARHADALTIRALATLVEQQKTIIAETVAACKTCDDVIGEFLVNVGLTREEEGLEVLRPGFVKLDAACHLAGRAVKLAEPQVNEELWSQVEPKLRRALGFAPLTIAESEKAMAEAKAVPMTDEAIERIVDYATKEPSEPPGYSEFREHAKAVVEASSKLSEKEARAMIDAASRGWANRPESYKASGSECERIHVDLLGPFGVVDGQPARPVAVEMRAWETPDEQWLWECKLVDRWIPARVLADTALKAYSTDKKSAIENGNAWLAALGKQLGVPLVADWKEGE